MFESYGKPGLYRGTRPGWVWAAIVGTGILAAFVHWVLQAQPLLDRTVQLSVPPALPDHPRFKGMMAILRCIYRNVEFQVLPHGAPSRVPAVFYVELTDKIIGAPAGTGLDPKSGRRGIQMSLAHSALGLRTLAHEFGHHKTGDVGVSPWPFFFQTIQNTLFDIRIDVSHLRLLHLGRCRSVRQGAEA